MAWDFKNRQDAVCGYNASGLKPEDETAGHLSICQCFILSLNTQSISIGRHTYRGSWGMAAVITALTSSIIINLKWSGGEGGVYSPVAMTTRLSRLSLSTE